MKKKSKAAAKFPYFVNEDIRFYNVSDDVHVYPLFGKEHDTDHGLMCWCDPKRDDEEPRVILHRASN